MGDDLDPKEEKEGEEELDPKGAKDDLREINLGDDDDFGPEENGLDDMLPEEDLLLFPKKAKGHPDTEEDLPSEDDSLESLIDEELDEIEDPYDDVDNW